MAKHKKPVSVKVTLNVGIRCKRCGKKFLNPIKRITHLCVIRMDKRVARKKGSK